MKTWKKILIGTLSSAFAGYAGNMLNLLFGLNYMEASALSGASIFPALIGGFFGYSIYYFFNDKIPFLSIFFAIPIGIATYAAIASIIVTPVNNVEVSFATYGRPFMSISSALFGGVVVAVLLGLNLKKDGRKINPKLSDSTV